MDCNSTSAAVRVCECDVADQCPKERKPIFFILAFYEPSNCADVTAKMRAVDAESIDWVKRHLLSATRVWSAGRAPPENPSMANRARRMRRVLFRTLLENKRGVKSLVDQELRALKPHSTVNQQHFAADVITLGNAHEIDAAGRLGRRSGAAERD
jgi:hypothetical protein